MNLVLTITCLLACIALVYLFYKYNHLQNEVTALQFQLNNITMTDNMVTNDNLDMVNDMDMDISNGEDMLENDNYDEEITNLESQVTDVNELINQYKQEIEYSDNDSEDSEESDSDDSDSDNEVVNKPLFNEEIKNKLKNKDLRELCGSLSISRKGNKEVLLKRLLDTEHFNTCDEIINTVEQKAQ